MKNNKFKLILFILLLGILFIPKTTITSAEEARGDTTNRTITIKGAGKDHTFKAYQIFKGDLHTDEEKKDVLSNIKWGDAVDDGKLLEALKSATETVIEIKEDDSSSNETKALSEIFGSCKTARDVAEILSLYENDSDMVRIFAELASSHLKTDAEGLAPISSSYNEGTSTYTLVVPTDGYYLIKDETDELSEKNEFYTRYILKVANNVEVNVKGEVPTVDKEVANTGNGQDKENLNHNDKDLKNEKVLSAETGEALEFTLTGTLPTNYNDYKSYKYIFHDTLSKGLTFISDSIKVYKVIDGTEEEITKCTTESNLSEKKCYTLEVKNNEEPDGQTSLTVKIEDLKQIISDEDFAKEKPEEKDKETKIVVKYYAYLNKDAVVGEDGNTNTVYLEYSNNPNKGQEGKTGKTPDEEVTVYTYQLDIEKKDGKKDTPLKGVGFKLYKKIKNAEGEETEKTVYAVMQKNGEEPNNNPYIIDKWVESPEEATELITGEDGNISIKGLKAGTYYLKETTTPKGYNTIEDVTITIEETLTGNEEKATEQSLESLTIEATWKDNEKDKEGETTTGDPNKGVVKTTILNMPGSILPFTGGMGTLLFYIIGFVLVITSFIIIGLKYKNRKSEQTENKPKKK